MSAKVTKASSPFVTFFLPFASRASLITLGFVAGLLVSQVAVF